MDRVLKLAVYHVGVEMYCGKMTSKAFISHVNIDNKLVTFNNLEIRT